MPLMIPQARRALLLTAAATLACSASAAHAQADLQKDMLAVHNAERSAVSVPDLQWDQDLADEAREYAEKLAQTTGLTHDDAPENLWRGPASATYTEIAQAWAKEKDNYTNAVFATSDSGSKAISKTGKWTDIGHYSQMVWRGTARVGCAAVKSAAHNDMVGICRYSTAGNVQGQWAYGPSSTAPSGVSTLQERLIKHWNAARGGNWLTWDPKLAADAQASLNPRLGDSNLGAYRPPYGEIMGAAGGSVAPSPRTMLLSWLDSKHPYRGAVVDPKFRKVGCATGAQSVAGSNRRILLCRFGS